MEKALLKQVPQAVFIERPNCINCGSEYFKQLSSGRYTDKPLVDFLAADPWGEDPAPYLQIATWSLVKCSDCSQVFHHRILDECWNERRFSQWMSAAAIKAFEAGLGEPSKRAFSSAEHHIEHILRIEKLTRSIRGDVPVKLLDFGCGFGSFLEACNHFGFQSSGIDRSIGRRSEASVEIYPSLGSLAGQQFHAITLFEVLEHLDEPTAILVQLAEHLVHGGILVLETPDCSGVTDIRSHRDYHLVHPLEHINAFTHDTLKSIAERHGFRHIDRGAAIATAEIPRAIKRVGKHVLRKDGRSTQLYFRKL